LEILIFFLGIFFYSIKAVIYYYIIIIIYLFIQEKINFKKLNLCFMLPF